VRVEADFGVFLGLDRDSSPSQGGFEDELWAGGLKDGQTFSYPGVHSVQLTSRRVHGCEEWCWGNHQRIALC